MSFTGLAAPLSQFGLTRSVDLLGVEPAALWTVLAVETRGCGFLSNRRPLILFERHIFHQRTGGAHSAANPSISSRTPGGYFGGLREYERLERAMELDRRAALESASWGIGQVMGFNATMVGFDSVETFVASTLDGEDAQLAAAANFLRARRLHEPLARHDWAAFARGYNGPDFARNQYDRRLAAAFQAFSHGPLPDLSVRQAQVLLMYLGIDAGAIDGIVGRRTRSAVVRFREEHGLRHSDEIDDEFTAALLTVAGQASAAGPR